jgi:hypothetical protein
MLKDFMNELSKELKSEEPLAPNEQQAYSLQLKEDWSIEISELSQKGFVFFSNLAECPHHDIEDFFLKIMVANLFGKETGGNIIGLDKEGMRVTFSGYLAKPVKYSEFRNYVEDFINYAEAWRDEIESLKTKDATHQ